MSREVALFDLDGTLIDCNSGRLRVASEWRSGRIGSRDAVWAAWWLARYSLGLGAGLDRVFEIAVAQLAGTDEEALDGREPPFGADRGGGGGSDWSPEDCLAADLR